MGDSESEYGEAGDGAMGKLVNVARHPYEAATSKPAQRAYVTTAVTVLVMGFLFVASSITYIIFYYNYVPNIGAEHVVHLQFGNGHPHGTVYLANTLISQQPYDISISMHLPRTASNLATGNFMIDMALLTPTVPLMSPVELLQSSIGAADPPSPHSDTPVSRSRRPAIMTHISPLVENAHIVANMLWFIVGWKRESEKLDVKMFERISFARGQKNVPDRIQIVVEADEKMQFYDAAVRVHARFHGLRWIMYNHRIFSFVFFTSAFFGVSLFFAGGAYFLFGARASDENSAQAKQEPARIKSEDLSDPLSTADLSDTPRRFPGLGRRQGLAYTGHSSSGFASGQDVRIKEEESPALMPLTAVEADDEDEEADSWRDSGIGTGRESDRRAGPGPRRRKSSRDL